MPKRNQRCSRRPTAPGFIRIADPRVRLRELGDSLSAARTDRQISHGTLNWRMNAAQATSGGEGSARPLDVHRVAKDRWLGVINMKDAVIVSAVRTAVGKAPKGTLRNTRRTTSGGGDQRAVARAGVDASLIDDVIMGCAFPEAERDGTSLVRR